MTVTRRIVWMAFVAMLSVSVGACGKKARDLDPADGGASKFPRTYPGAK